MADPFVAKCTCFSCKAEAEVRTLTVHRCVWYAMHLDVTGGGQTMRVEINLDDAARLHAWLGEWLAAKGGGAP
jgi:hypothetical protein